jgi:hypothetical protein
MTSMLGILVSLVCPRASARTAHLAVIPSSTPADFAAPRAIVRRVCPSAKGSCADRAACFRTAVPLVLRGFARGVPVSACPASRTATVGQTVERRIAGPTSMPARLAPSASPRAIAVMEDPVTPRSSTAEPARPIPTARQKPPLASVPRSAPALTEGSAGQPHRLERRAEAPIGPSAFPSSVDDSDRNRRRSRSCPG